MAAPTCSSTRSWRRSSTLVFSLVVTFVIAKALDATIGLRVSEEDEYIGLDQSLHSETAYNFGELGARVIG